MQKMNIGDEVPEVCWSVDESMLCPICNTNCMEDYDAVHFCRLDHQYKHNGKDTVRIQDRSILNFKIFHTKWYNIFNRIRYWILAAELSRVEGDQWVSVCLPDEEDLP